MLEYKSIEPKVEKEIVHYPFGEKMIENKNGDILVATVSHCALYLTSEYLSSPSISEVTCDSCRRRAKAD